eukprot:GHVS01083069.1.p1 GENE.GHVS01083069.1~~GHVS01083069.1.p1  ORF type:complete len:455 (+),score=178.85 GHVS01083069.1:141-1505(+)
MRQAWIVIFSSLLLLLPCHYLSSHCDRCLQCRQTDICPTLNHVVNPPPSPNILYPSSSSPRSFCLLSHVSSGAFIYASLSRHHLLPPSSFTSFSPSSSSPPFPPPSSTSAPAPYIPHPPPLCLTLLFVQRRKKKKKKEKPPKTTTTLHSGKKPKGPSVIGAAISGSLSTTSHDTGDSYRNLFMREFSHYLKPEFEQDRIDAVERRLEVGRERKKMNEKELEKDKQQRLEEMEGEEGEENAEEEEEEGERGGGGSEEEEEEEGEGGGGSLESDEEREEGEMEGRAQHGRHISSESVMSLYEGTRKKEEEEARQRIAEKNRESVKVACQLFDQIGAVGEEEVEEGEEVVEEGGEGEKKKGFDLKKLFDRMGELRANKHEWEVDKEDLVPSGAYIACESVQRLRGGYGRHESDTGSAEFQVAGLTARIICATRHMQINRKVHTHTRGELYTLCVCVI